MRIFSLAIAAALLAVPAAATPPIMTPPPPAPPPRLLVVIGVDQLSGELFDQYRPHFTGGLARLARGVVFRNGYQSHAATETCPGYSTILTGARPARSGIIANNWFDPSVARPKKEIYCAEDVERTPANATNSPYTVAATNLRATTLGDLLKTARPGSRTVSVAGKDRAAVMLGGRRPDQRWFFAGQGFTTDLEGVAAPESIALVNSSLGQAMAMARAPLDPPALCAAKAQTYTISGGRKVVGNGRFARRSEEWSALRPSPEYDGAVLALAASLMQEMQLGRGTTTDLLAIGLSATDHVGHTFGTQGQEMCLQLLSLDRDLGDFFNLLDSNGIDYAVALTADHGSIDIPARVPGAAYARDELLARALGAAIGAKLGLTGPVLRGDIGGDLWFDPALTAADRGRVGAEVLGLANHDQVEAVFTKADIAATPMPTSPPDRWSIRERVRAAFDPVRSGDFYLVLKEKVSPILATSETAGTHGTVWDYDRRVPILLWRAGWAAADRAEAIETVDIMPTLAAMSAVAVARGSVDGKCLDGIPGVICGTR